MLWATKYSGLLVYRRGYFRWGFRAWRIRLTGAHSQVCTPLRRPLVLLPLVEDSSSFSPILQMPTSRLKKDRELTGAESGLNEGFFGLWYGKARISAVLLLRIMQRGSSFGGFRRTGYFGSLVLALVVIRVPNGPSGQVLKKRPTGQSRREEGTRID